VEYIPAHGGVSPDVPFPSSGTVRGPDEDLMEGRNRRWGA
jgi:hypothetical protein